MGCRPAGDAEFARDVAAGTAAATWGQQGGTAAGGLCIDAAGQQALAELHARNAALAPELSGTAASVPSLFAQFVVAQHPGVAPATGIAHQFVADAQLHPEDAGALLAAAVVAAHALKDADLATELFERAASTATLETDLAVLAELAHCGFVLGL